MCNASERDRQREPVGGGTASCRHMARAVPKGSSRSRGTEVGTSRAAFDQIAWLAPSLIATQPWVRGCASRSRRFNQRR